MSTPALRVAVPAEGYHRRLISCQDACPVRTDARGYVRAIAAGRFEEAFLIARGPNPFASICGRVCGAPCEIACRRGKIPREDEDGTYIGLDRPIAIRALKRFVCEQYGVDGLPPEVVLEEAKAFEPTVSAHADELAALLQALAAERVVPADGQRVAIVGAGPAGLSAAHDLALLGLTPVVFELEPIPAGMLVFGVPEYRLPRQLVADEIAVIRALGAEIRCGVKVGVDISFDSLRRDFAAVVVAVGAKRPRALNLPGEAGPGVWGGVDLLRSVALGEPLDLGADVVVIGGGNVAYDVARTVVRQSAEDAARTAARLPATRTVRLVSLESLEEMPADTLEIHEGDEEGVERWNGWGPLAIERDDGGRVTGVLFQRCLRVYDDARRFAPVFDPAQQQRMACETVLIAAGQSTDLSFLAEGGRDVEQLRPGWPKVDPATLATTAPGVFVAGDLAHGTRLIIDAVASGKKAARSVYEYVTGRTLTAEVLELFQPLVPYDREKRYEQLPRVPIPTVPAEERLAEPGRLVERGYGEADALREGSRCLDCGVTPVFDGTRCILCGGCADVCPTLTLKLVSLRDMATTPELAAAIAATFGPDADLDANSAILKDEDRCIRCALCVMRCPVDAIRMERVQFTTCWSSTPS